MARARFVKGRAGGRRVFAAALLVLALAGAAEPATEAAPTPADRTADNTDSSAAPFLRARARGTLVIGIPHLAPPPAPGAKIRTPERLDTPVAERLGAALGLPVTLRQVAPGEAAALLAAGEVDAVLADQVEGQSAAGARAPDVARVPTGYVVRPQAVIRSDTPMRRWQDAAGRSVCMAGAAAHAQELAARWGAKVRTFRVPSDALVAVREGACDIGMIDDAVWAPLMRFPEWKNFSATLPLDGPLAERVWLVAGQGGQAEWLERQMRQWRRDGAWKTMTDQWARDVAFDVYLDQEVPDCHG
ncbi:transporter substrate-binding domain-containing protein [Bordetella genomosp. 13]|uniref:ABC transporter substrate-binding protein n=1 Tax=Bordetella genomosp. 13 TaxID=463040 RepID=A0A1W6ZDS3_9BORD|nr:transporter substrate-binding domain-containing protein [Bordetella genomosp. 13]ARP95415.1 ABC transporter substrate-binding protein [Bordetella genomosp. 13]